MHNLKNTVEGYARYRGREGHLSFLLHRITGLGTLLFLIIHIVDMAWFYWAPEMFEHAIALYRTPPFLIGELGLVFCVFFHGVNGLRIAYVDMVAPNKWTIAAQRSAVRWTLIGTLVLWLPAAGIMVYNAITHSAEAGRVLAHFLF